jgi:hypothetical protein
MLANLSAEVRGKAADVAAMSVAMQLKLNRTRFGDLSSTPPIDCAWQRYLPAQRTASDCSCASISAYLDTLVSSPFGTICSSISAVPFDGGYVTVIVPA